MGCVAKLFRGLGDPHMHVVRVRMPRFKLPHGHGSSRVSRIDKVSR